MQITPNEEMNRACLDISQFFSEIFYGVDKTHEKSAINFNIAHLHKITRGNNELIEYLTKLGKAFKDTSFVMFCNDRIRLFNQYELFLNDSKLNIRVIPNVLSQGELLVYSIIYDNFANIQYYLMRYLMFYNKFCKNILTYDTETIMYIYNNIDDIVNADKKILLPMIDVVKKSIETMIGGDLINNELYNKHLFIKFTSNSKTKIKYTLTIEYHKNYDEKYAITDQEIFRADDIEIISSNIIDKKELHKFLVNLIVYGRI